MLFFGARVNLKAPLYALNGGRDEVSGEQLGPTLRPLGGRRARLRGGRRAVRHGDGLAGEDLRQRRLGDAVHRRHRAIGAHAALLPPVGTPVNLIVMAPSGYRFANYTKFGAPIALWWLAVVAFVVPLHRSF
jgi:hypothetical protein